MSRLVVVSNRVPPAGVVAPGGLAISLLATMRAHRGLWFGWSGEIRTDDTAPAGISEIDGVTYATIPLTQKLYQQYYNGFANGTLWPLFHSLLDEFRYETGDHVAYHQANEWFASRLRPLVRPGDVIWAHDYHLIPLAQRLRAKGVANPMGHFLHAPFPHFESFRTLPDCADFAGAMLAYDVLGFQTEVSRRHFLEAVRALRSEATVGSDETIRMGARIVRTLVRPVSVDLDAVAQEAETSMASEPVSRLVRSVQGQALILGVDRLDYCKGVIQRLDAYGRFLDAFPGYRGKVTLLQISPLSRERVHAYARIRAALEQAAGRINGRFAEADWTPIRYLNRNYPHATLMGIMRAAGVCVVTALNDGMNLVAKEFVAAQDPRSPGVLVLSNRAGAAGELTDALLVNPYDIDAIGRATHRALEMPLAERQSRHQRMLATLRGNDIGHWHTSFVRMLTALTPRDGVRRNGVSEARIDA